MSDRFDDLRWSPQRRGSTPDVDAIKARSRTIVRQRYSRMGGAAIAMGLLVVVGVVVASMPNDSAQRLATDALPTIDTRTPRPGAESLANASPEADGTAPRRAGAASGGAVASPTAKSGSSTTSGGEAALAPSSESAQDRATDPPPPRFSVTLDVTTTGRGAYFSLRLCNITDQSQKLTFPTGQRYDFDVYREGSIVWRWSHGRAFTQVYGEESFRPEECKIYNASWDGRESNGDQAPPGQYTAVGIVTSSPQQRSGAKAFTLG